MIEYITNFVKVSRNRMLRNTLYLNNYIITFTFLNSVQKIFHEAPKYNKKYNFSREILCLLTVFTMYRLTEKQKMGEDLEDGERERRRGG